MSQLVEVGIKEHILVPWIILRIINDLKLKLTNHKMKRKGKAVGLGRSKICKAIRMVPNLGEEH